MLSVFYSVDIEKKMHYKLFFVFAVACAVQALDFEKKEDFSYCVGLGNMEYYLRKGYEEIKECYSESEEKYKTVLENFEKELDKFSKKYKTTEEKNVINRVRKIVQDLKKYQIEMKNKLANINPSNSPDIANYVDKVRQEVKKDHATHSSNIKNSRPWLQDKFKKLEENFKPLRKNFMDEANTVVEEIVKCMKVPKCNTRSA